MLLVPEYYFPLLIINGPHFQHLVQIADIINKKAGSHITNKQVAIWYYIKIASVAHCIHQLR